MIYEQNYTTYTAMFIGNQERSSSGDEILPFEMGYLPTVFQKKAEVELKETPENREKCLRLIKEMARKDKNFNNLTIDDDFLLQYLRCRKFNIARAFSQLKSFVILRKNNMESFTNIKFEKLQVTTKKNVVTFLPWRDPDGCAILLVELDNWYPEEFPLEEVKRAVVVMLIQSLRDPMTQVNGFKVIFNVKSNPVRHLRYCTPSNIYLLYHATQECVPGRFKEVHIVNKSFTLKAGWFMLKAFMSDKIKKRITFHDDPETLLHFFPRAVLPVEYGGDLKHYDLTDWLRRVCHPDMLATIGVGSSTTPSAHTRG